MDILSILSSMAGRPGQLQALKAGVELKGRVLSKNPEGQYLVQVEGNGVVKVESEQPLDPGKLYSINIRSAGNTVEFIFTPLNEESVPQPDIKTGLPFVEEHRSGTVQKSPVQTYFTQPGIMDLVRKLEHLIFKLGGKAEQASVQEAGFSPQGEKAFADPLSELLRSTRTLSQILQQKNFVFPAKLAAEALSIQDQLRSIKQTLALAQKQSPDAQISEVEKELGQLLKMLDSVAGRVTPNSAAEIKPEAAEARLPSLQVMPLGSGTKIPVADQKMVSGYILESQESKTILDTTTGKIEVAATQRPPSGSWLLAMVQNKLPPDLPKEPYIEGEIQFSISPRLREPLAKWGLPDTPQNRKAVLFLLGQRGYVTRSDLISLTSAMAMLRSDTASRSSEAEQAKQKSHSGTLPPMTGWRNHRPALENTWAAVSVLRKAGVPVKPEILAKLIELAEQRPDTGHSGIEPHSLPKLIALLQKIVEKPQNLPFSFVAKARELTVALNRQISAWPQSEKAEITAERIRHQVENSGMFYESKIARFAADPKQVFSSSADLKGILLELVRLLDQTSSANTPDLSTLRQEAGRMLARTEQQQIFPPHTGEQFVLPLSLDGEYVPVNLIFRRQGRRAKYPGSRLVSIHCETTQIGHIRADIRMTGKRVRIALACENDAAAALFQKESQDLHLRLQNSGIVLDKFSVRNLITEGQEDLDNSNQIDIVI